MKPVCWTDSYVAFRTFCGEEPLSCRQTLPRARDSGRGTPLTLGTGHKSSTGDAFIPGTLLTQFGDSVDATRGYPEDSTDETNSLNLIPFN